MEQPTSTDLSDLHQQDTDFEFIKILIPHLKQKTFIDIGAEKGTFTQFLHNLGMTGTFFEPLPKFEPELKALAYNTQCTFLPYAVDQRDGVADFYSAFDASGNPKDYFSSLHPLENDERINHKKITTVTCRSLNSLLREGLVNNQAGIVKIDTEGNDLNVMKGMSEMEAEVLMCEYFMPGIYAGWLQGHPLGLIEEAKKLGFEHYITIKRFDEFEFVSLCNDAFIDKQWGNLIFCKKNIFNAVKTELDKIIAKKELQLFNQFLESTQILKDTCEERLELINRLNVEAQLNSTRGTRLSQKTQPIQNNNPMLHLLMEELKKYVFDIKNDLRQLTIDHSNMQKDWELLSQTLSAKLSVIEETHQKAYSQLESINQTRLKVIEEQEKEINKHKRNQIRARIKTFFRPRLGELYQYKPRRYIAPEYYKKKPTLINPPLISIVTPSFNQGDFLEKTILSVIDQKYHALEYIIQDGDSRDNTIEVIKRYQSSLKHWQSVKDKGQSHAINLGFAHTTGEIMAYLNSDDLLLPGSLHYIANYFAKHPEVDVVYGHRVLIDEYDQEIGKWILPKHDSNILIWADYIPQETLFWRRRIWEKAGGHIDENFRFAMDWDLLLRFREAGAKFVRLPRFLGAFRVHLHQKTSSEMSHIGVEEMERLRLRSHGRKVTYLEIKKHILPYIAKHVVVHKLYRAGVLKY